MGMKGMLLDMPKTNIRMKKSFLGSILILSATFCKGQETIIYYNSFNDEASYDSLLAEVGGGMLDWTSGSIDQSYDGSPVLEANSSFTQTPTIYFHDTDVNEVSVSVRVKKGYGQDAQFLLEYSTTGINGDLIWETLYEGSPNNYYHHITSTIELGWCDWFALRFKTIGGTGWHYVDDLFIKTPTPECGYNGEDCPIDTNGDNFINYNDMLNLLAAYGSICE